MSQLLEIQPSHELKFMFEVLKQSTCNVRLINKTDQHVAFKVKTTSPKKYCVRPNVGVILPKETFDFVVLMQNQRSPPTDMVCKDKFLVQGTIVPAGTMEDDVTSHMFSKDGGKYIEERKLKVILVSPSHSPELSPMHTKFKLVPPVEDSVVAGGVYSRTERHSLHHVDVDHAKELKLANKEEEKPIASVNMEAVKHIESELTKAAEPVIDVESQPIKSVESDSTDELEARPVKETKPTVLKGAMKPRLVKNDELTEAVEPVSMMDVKPPPIEFVESNSVKKLEATVVEGIDPTMIKDEKDLRLMNDVELAKAGPVTVKVVESPLGKVVESNLLENLEAIPGKGTEPRMMEDAKDLVLAKDAELKKAAVPVTMRDVESPPGKVVESNLLENLEARPGKGTEPRMMEDAKGLGLGKDAELKKPAEPVTMRDVESLPIQVVESNSVEKLEATPVKGLKGTHPRMEKDAEDLTLAKDVEVLKSKLLELESKFGQTEKNISKLVEERRLTIQEREFLHKEVALLKTQRVQKTAHGGFPPLFLWLVAVFSIVIGYIYIN